MCLLLWRSLYPSLLLIFWWIHYGFDVKYKVSSFSFGESPDRVVAGAVLSPMKVAASCIPVTMCWKQGWSRLHISLAWAFTLFGVSTSSLSTWHDPGLGQFSLANMLLRLLHRLLGFDPQTQSPCEVDMALLLPGISYQARLGNALSGPESPKRASWAQRFSARNILSFSLLLGYHLYCKEKWKPQRVKADAAHDWDCPELME